ncbi:MAG: FitA-like ribbon-helix-helix domain-containing protein [Armatimonadota bacterium]
MGQITLRHLDEATLQELRRIAWSRGHSLEEEAEEMLKWAVREMVRTERQQLLQQIGSFHANLGNTTFSSSADLIREDRDSR